MGSGPDSGGTLKQVRQEFGGRLWRSEFCLRIAYSSGSLVPSCQLSEARFQNIIFGEQVRGFWEDDVLIDPILIQGLYLRALTGLTPGWEPNGLQAPFFGR